MQNLFIYPEILLCYFITPSIIGEDFISST